MSAVHVEIVLNEELYEKLLVELDLSGRRPALVLNHPGFARGTNASEGVAALRGMYDPRTHTVYVANAAHGVPRERLIEATRHLTDTFLHEMRHAHQHTHWTPEMFGTGRSGGDDYHDSFEELDANAWAEFAYPMFKGVLRLQRRPVGGRSGFGRMTERAGRG
jgi:hypothetical protein